MPVPAAPVPPTPTPPEPDEAPVPGVPGPGFEDALLVAARPPRAYAWAGTQVLVDSLDGLIWRMLRQLASLGASLVPALAGGLLWWFVAAPAETRSRLLLDESNADAWLAARGFWLGGLELTAIFALAVALLFARAWCDAAWFGGLRDTLTGRPRTLMARWKESGAAFIGLALLRMGLFIGSLMFLSPFFRVAGRLVLAEGASPRTQVFIGVSVAFAVLWLSTVSFFLSLASAWLTWRPRFFAGTLVAAIAAPFRQWRLFIRIAPVWLGAWSVLWAIGSWLLRDGAGLALQGAWQSSAFSMAGGVVAGAFAGLAFAAGAWGEAFLVTLAGQRLGDAELPESGLQRASTRVTPAAMSTPPTQQRFDPPVRGYFVAPPAARGEVPSRVPFSAILREPEPVSPEALNWTTGDPELDAVLTPAALDGAVAPEAVTAAVEDRRPARSAPLVPVPSTGFGLSDDRGQAPPTLAPPPVPTASGSFPAVESMAALSAGEPVLPGLTAPVETEPQTMQELMGQVGRITWMSASGALERSLAPLPEARRPEP